MTAKKKSSSKKQETNLNLVLPDFARYFFILAIVIILLLFFWVISPFFNVLIYASLLAVIFHPFQNWLTNKFKGHSGYAAFFSTLLVMLIVLTPLAIFTIFLAQEAVDAYQFMESKLYELDIKSLEWKGLQDLPVIGDSIHKFAESYGLNNFIEQSDVDLAILSTLKILYLIHTIYFP